MAKENINQMEREWTIWENIFVNDTSDKGLISKTCKGLGISYIDNSNYLNSLTNFTSISTEAVIKEKYPKYQVNCIFLDCLIAYFNELKVSSFFGTILCDIGLPVNLFLSNPWFICSRNEIQLNNKGHGDLISYHQWLLFSFSTHY